MAVRDDRRKEKWTSGKIIQRKGALNYEVKTQAGGIWKRHADQIRDTVPRLTLFRVPSDVVISIIGDETQELIVKQTRRLTNYMYLR